VKLIGMLVIGVALGLGGYALWHHMTARANRGSLTARAVMRPVRCATPTNIITCVPIGADATTFSPRQLVEITLSFTQPTNTQGIAVVPRLADGSSAPPVRPAPLSHVTSEPLLVIRACDLGTAQTVADNVFDIVRDGIPTPIGHFMLTVQAPSGTASRTCPYPKR